MNRLQQQNEENRRRLLMDRSSPGRVGTTLAPLDVPEQELPADSMLRDELDFPEISESELVRYFSQLSQFNFSIDHNFYPLGSCTMKYNPKRHERPARLPGLADLHPYQRTCDQQGMLRLLHDMQEMLAEIAGLPAVSLQPAAGAQGELASLLVASAWFRSRQESRTRVIFPSSAHGTNPASAAIAGSAEAAAAPRGTGPSTKPPVRTDAESRYWPSACSTRLSVAFTSARNPSERSDAALPKPAANTASAPPAGSRRAIRPLTLLTTPPTEPEA